MANEKEEIIVAARLQGQFEYHCETLNGLIFQKRNEWLGKKSGKGLNSKWANKNAELFDGDIGIMVPHWKEIPYINKNIENYLAENIAFANDLKVRLEQNFSAKKFDISFSESWGLFCGLIGRFEVRKSEATLEKEAVLAAFRGRVMGSADKLFNAQMTRAQGMTFLYKIEKYYEGKGDNRTLKRKAPVQVTAQWEIEVYLDGVYEDNDIDDPDDTYYFITTTPPDNKSIDSMLDRTFGKAPQHLELAGDPNNPIGIAITKVEKKAADILEHD